MGVDVADALGIDPGVLEAPRARAASISSSTSSPAPSPITNPSRRRSKGRETPDSDSACRALKQAKPNSVSVASAPPATTASASPYWIIRIADPSAWAPAAQADTTPYICPRKPWRMVATMQPTRSESYGASSPEPQPAWARASSEATTAIWAKRSSRRISLTDRCSEGSKLRHHPAPSSIPTTPRAHSSCNGRAPTPSGVTAPMPVIATRRFTTPRAR